MTLTIPRLRAFKYCIYVRPDIEIQENGYKMVQHIMEPHLEHHAVCKCSICQSQIYFRVVVSAWNPSAFQSSADSM